MLFKHSLFKSECLKGMCKARIFRFWNSVNFVCNFEERKFFAKLDTSAFSVLRKTHSLFINQTVALWFTILPWRERKCAASYLHTRKKAYLKKKKKKSLFIMSIHFIAFSQIIQFECCASVGSLSNLFCPCVHSVYSFFSTSLLS